MTTVIHSNGSKWAGEPPDTIETLLDVLARHPLNRAMFEGDFIDSAPIDICGVAIGGPGNVSFFGNFLTVSHVFSIDTDEPDVIARLTAAIEANQQRPDYLSQPTPEQAAAAEAEYWRSRQKIANEERADALRSELAALEGR